MPRNSSGIYTLPESPFQSGTVIESSVMNSDLSDIATALTGSLATTGVSTLTGPLYLYSGTVTAPSLTWDDAMGAGFYISSSNMIMVQNSVSVARFYASATVNWYYKQFFANSVGFAGGLSFGGAISSSVTIGGHLTVYGGLNVGFNSAPVADRIALADGNFCLDYDGGVDPFWAWDSGDYIEYSRANNQFVWNISATPVYKVDARTVFFGNVINVNEIAATASASAGFINVYAKDNSGTTRVYSQDDDGNEIALGGPGQWERIAQTDVATSVASITYSLSKQYSRLSLVMTSVNGNTGSAVPFFTDISDNGGSTLVSARSVFGNLGTDVQSTSHISVGTMGGTGSISRRNGKIDFNLMDRVGPKQFHGSLVQPGNDLYYQGGGQIASCSVANAIVIALETGTIFSGVFTLYGLMSR